MSSLTKFFIATAGIALFNVGTLAQAATIDTTAGWLGGGYIFGGSRFGQVFTVPSDNVLDSFTFFLSSVGSPGTPHLVFPNTTKFRLRRVPFYFGLGQPKLW